jgi:glycosyltransferase involved in cell wall biosynthesis
MTVTVIIPVYQAKRYLADAVASVLLQPEVVEILLIDDGSTDGSDALCNELAGQHPTMIRILQHEGRQNRGAGASRNLGLHYARSPLIAFLDADDLYLEGRFSTTVSAFEAHPDADGVYAPVGTLRDSGTSRSQTAHAGPELAWPGRVDPKQLFRVLAQARDGYIHLNGLTLKRSALDETLLFDASLRQCQDTEFLLRLSAKHRLYPSATEHPVALRRVHDANRVHNVREALHYRYLCMRKCALHDFYGSRDRSARWAILNRMARASRPVAFAKRWRLPVTPFRIFVILGFLLRGR